LRKIELSKDRRDIGTYANIVAAMTVHQAFGAGCPEAVYQEALEIEFQLQDITYERVKRLSVYYRGNRLGTLYKADFDCRDQSLASTYRHGRSPGIELSQSLRIS